MRKFSRKTLLAAGLATLLAASAGWYFSRRTNPPLTGHGHRAVGTKSSASSSVAGPLTARAERRDLAFNIEVTGDVTPAASVEIKPEVSGRIIRLGVQAGQTVKKGDLLVELDDTDLKTERAGAQTDIARAQLVVEREEANFARGRGLFSARLSSKETFDNLANDLAMAQNALVKAQRSLQLVEDKLTKTRILSPTDGTVLTLPVVEGVVVTAAASVNSGTSLMTVADLSKLIVVTNVNQVDVAKVLVGQRVKLSMDALREPPMDATVSFIAPLATVKNNVKGFQVEAKIENPSARLRPGMTVNLTIPIERADDAVSVPIAAIFNDTDGTSKIVYVRGGDGAPQKRRVKVGVTNYFYTQITSGLDAGEEVALVPPEQKKS